MSFITTDTNRNRWLLAVLLALSDDRRPPLDHLAPYLIANVIAASSV